MEQVISIIQIMRPKQWIKNSIILLPLLFSGQITNGDSILKSLLICFIFSIYVGSSYIINDVNDKEKDKLHPVKKYRPIASDKISTTTGILAAIFLGITSLASSYLIFHNILLTGLFIVYLINTLIYTVYIKKLVIIDIFSIALGFVIRGLIGIVVINAQLSPRFLVMLFLGALWLGFLKRYQEVKLGSPTRSNINQYNQQFLEQIVTIFTTAILISYTLYTFNSIQSQRFLVTLPFVYFGIVRYYYNIFVLNKIQDSIEDIILNDYYIIMSIIGYLLTIGIIIYILHG